MVVEYYSFANDSVGNSNETIPHKYFVVQVASTTTTTLETTTTTESTTTSTTTTTQISTTTTIPSNTETKIYLNGTEGNFYYLNNTYVNFTVWVNVSGTVYLDTNITGWTTRFGDSPLTRIVQLNASQNNTYYNITGYFPGNATHDPSSQTHYAIVYVTTSVTTTTVEATTTVGGDHGNGGGTTTTTIRNTTSTTTTRQTTTTTITTTTTTIPTTTTTIKEEERGLRRYWYVIPIIAFSIVLATIMLYLRYVKSSTEHKAFQQLKEKWKVIKELVPTSILLKQL
jgi:hypothetical protein